MSDIRTILITGGAGFVGSSLAVAFRDDFPDVRVVAMDNLTRRGSELNLPRLQRAGVEFLHGDVRQTDDFAAAGHFDLLIDCAAEPSVQAGLGTSPKPVFDINLNGTINSLEAAARHDAAFVFLSTSRVYPIAALNAVAWSEADTRFEWIQHDTGVSPQGITEEFPLHGSRSYYGASKLASELIAQEYAANAGMPVIINRCGVLTGPWQMGKVDQGVVSLWVLRHHFGQALKYIGYGGTGRQVRDILHVHDLYRLIRRQLDSVTSWDGSVYNVGGGRDVSVSLAELTGITREIVGRSVPLSSVPKTSTVDLRVYLTDNSRVSSAFDWRPQKSPARIIEDIYEWVLQHEDSLARLQPPTAAAVQPRRDGHRSQVGGR
ncbi:MAG: NAD-dependent epimerase/dehydratase family protein [Planctomycetaceae bacterium]|nr:NAD-dependent epimerase/dehydratase family protein [Planctomycetaceae bacterium]